jgi:hypothetical protein
LTELIRSGAGVDIVNVWQGEAPSPKPGDVDIVKVAQGAGVDMHGSMITISVDVPDSQGLPVVVCLEIVLAGRATWTNIFTVYVKVVDVWVEPSKVVGASAGSTVMASISEAFAIYIGAWKVSSCMWSNDF